MFLIVVTPVWGDSQETIWARDAHTSLGIFWHHSHHGGAFWRNETQNRGFCSANTKRLKSQMLHLLFKRSDVPLNVLKDILNTELQKNIDRSIHSRKSDGVGNASFQKGSIVFDGPVVAKKSCPFKKERESILMRQPAGKTMLYKR